MGRRKGQKTEATNAAGEALSIPEVLRSRRRAWTAEELAELLNISVKTIYAMAKKGLLPSIRFSSNVRFDPASTAAWVEQHLHAA